MQEVGGAVAESAHRDFLAHLIFLSVAAVTGTLSAYVHK